VVPRLKGTPPFSPTFRPFRGFLQANIVLSPEEEKQRQRYLGSHRLRDLTAAYRDIPFSCCDPVVISEQAEGRILHNATACLLSFDRERTFMITNSHVLEAFRQSLSAHPTALFSFAGQHPFDPLSRIVTESTLRDVAIIDVTDLQVSRKLDRNSAIGSLLPHIADPWPSPTPEHGDSVVFGGWLECHRAQDGINVDFVATPFVGMRIDDVTETYATLTFEREYYVAGDGTTDHPILTETDLSGLSGSPVFKIVKSPIERPAFIGIVRDHLCEQDVVRVALLTSLNSQGLFEG
jgi:hypothetical protein